MKRERDTRRVGEREERNGTKKQSKHNIRPFAMYVSEVASPPNLSGSILILVREEKRKEEVEKRGRRGRGRERTDIYLDVFFALVRAASPVFR